MGQTPAKEYDANGEPKPNSTAESRNPGFFPRGWLIMMSISLVLFIAVSVPLGYFTRKSAQTIYAAVVTPVVWLIYLILLYFLIYRPLVMASDVYSEGECIYNDGEGQGVPLMSKEMHKLNRCLRTLSQETADLKAASDMLSQQMWVSEEDGNDRIMENAEEAAATAARSRYNNNNNDARDEIHSPIPDDPQ